MYYRAQTTQAYANPDSASDPTGGRPKTNGFIDAPHLRRKRRRLNNETSQHHTSQRNGIENHHQHPMEFFYRQPDKFQAFGQFVSATLSEIGDEKALSIVESFTASLVEAMRQKE